ncbi:PD-(D/E)XK nuclease family protein [Sunxiuqinia sp. A32]|uniref:PD-(D/E)XK nuclease family protein n=1 Tax=Sunxiuqinia sp. A32 TaxID=3461496 RepID=UPI004045CDFF
MDPFLKQVARHLYRKYNQDLYKVSIIFPNRRSCVFFNAYLNELLDQPVLGPEVITINDFIKRLSGLQLSDQIALIMRLHEIYKRETGHLEELDEFYFWGEILLNDFNDIDNYLLDAADLFQNIADLKEIESRFDYLTPEQKKAIESFWGNLGKAADSVNREKFMEIWNKLPHIYQVFKEELEQDGAVYNGLIYRDVVNKLPKLADELKKKSYAFIGFNALNACEKRILKSVNSISEVGFYWDYDPWFLNDQDHEASLFIRENLVQFPPPADFDLVSGENQNRKIKMISVPGQVAQAQILNQNQLLSNVSKEHHFDDVALVLAEESLLMPVVSSAGSRFDNINITMGYPFQNTPVYSLITAFIEGQKNCRVLDGKVVFYHRPALAILNHQLILGADSKELVKEIHLQNKIYIGSDDLQKNQILKLLFTKYANWRSFSESLLALMQLLAVKFCNEDEHPVSLEAEYLYQAYLSVQRLSDTLGDSGVNSMSLALYQRILIQHLQRISIPFEGEPLSGLQVMGILETRNLDFKKLVMFSVNEGKLPKTTSIHSFIPYHLRKAFGLPSYEEHDAMNAYYFYRLIHRAEEVLLVYDSSTDGLNTGEMSRYLLQLQYDSSFKAERYHLNFDFKASKPLPIKINATTKHLDKLLEYYSGKRLSPSALNTYLDCKLKFYFQHIARIRQKDELLEDVDPRLFGNLFHLAAEKLYSDFDNEIIDKKHLEALLLNKKKVEEYILVAFKNEYYKDKELADIKLVGNNILIAEHLKTYLEQMLKNDMGITPFRIIALEGDFEADFKLVIKGEERHIRIGGIVDRIDETEDGVRIIDYKTGRNLKLDYKSIDQLFDREYKDRRKEIMQTLVYCEIFSRTNSGKQINPAIYKIDQFFDDEFSPFITSNKTPINYKDVSVDFTESLQNLLNEIFSDTGSYEQTDDVKKCTNCQFNIICRRS